MAELTRAEQRTFRLEEAAFEFHVTEIDGARQFRLRLGLAWAIDALPMYSIYPNEGGNFARGSAESRA